MTRHLNALFLSGLLASASFIGPTVSADILPVRLFVTHADKPDLNVLDDTGATIASFPMSERPWLVRSESGQSVFAVQGKAGIVSVVASGLLSDGTFEEPKLTVMQVRGKTPSHIVSQGGSITIFFDGEGIARTIQEDAVLAGKAQPLEIQSGAAHHGVAMPFGAHMLVTEPNKDKPDELPIGIQVYSANGERQGAIHSCPDLHGEASARDAAVFACGTGLLVVTHGPAALQSRLIPYPPADEELRAGALRGGANLPYVLGNFGPNKLVLLETAKSDSLKLISLSGRIMQFATDPAREGSAYVLTDDGRLHHIDTQSAAVEKSAAMTGPYNSGGDNNRVRPRFAVAGDQIFVSDAVKRVLRIVDAGSFEILREIAVEQAPMGMIAVGGSGKTEGNP